MRQRAHQPEPEVPAGPEHQRTGDRLREVGLGELLAAHCTGEPAIRHFGEQVVPKGGRAVELGVGGRFELHAP